MLLRGVHGMNPLHERGGASWGRVTVARFVAGLTVASALILSSAPAAVATASAVPTPVRVLIPDAENLQYLAFWVALGAGYFRDEGLAVRVIPAGAPGAAASEFAAGGADVAILPPPQYGQAMSLAGNMLFAARRAVLPRAGEPPLSRR